MRDNIDDDVDDVDTYLVEATEFFRAEPSRYAPGFSGSELRTAPLEALYGPEAVWVCRDPARYEEFIKKLSPEQVARFHTDRRHNRILQSMARVAYAYVVYAGWSPSRWEKLSTVRRYDFGRAALFIERCLFTYGIGDHLRRISIFEEAIGVTTAFKLVYAGLSWGDVREPV